MISYPAILDAVHGGLLVFAVVGSIDVIIDGEPGTMQAITFGACGLDERGHSFAHGPDAVKVAQMIGAMRVLRAHGNFHPV